MGLALQSAVAATKLPVRRRDVIIAAGAVAAAGPPWGAACAQAAADAPPARSQPGASGQRDLQGQWLASAGPPDNRVTVGLSLQRGADGAMQARYTIDLLHVYGASLPALEPLAGGGFRIERFDVSILPAGDALSVSGLIDEPLLMRRVDALPQRPAAAVVPPGPRPVWQLNLGGPIFARAADHGHHVYLGNADGVMFAVDTRSAAVDWRFVAGRPIHGEATVTDAAVFFASDNGWLYRLNRADGKQVWRYDLGDARVQRVPPNPFVFDYDHRSPRPVLHDGVLYVGAGDGGFHAVDAATGERLWRFEADDKVRADAAVDGTWVVFGTLGGSVFGLDRATGQQRWRFKAAGPVTGTPVFAAPGGPLIVGDRGSRLHALKPGQAQALWAQNWWGSWIESTAVVRDGVGYIGSGDLFLVSAFDPATGRNLWRSGVGGWVLQRPAVGAARLYVSVSGARRRPAHFVTQQAGLTALDRRDGRVRCHWPAPAAAEVFFYGLSAAPVIVGSRVVVGGLDGTLRAFEDADA
jgi:outer membrane protein assembly factor BamB